MSTCQLNETMFYILLWSLGPFLRIYFLPLKPADSKLYFKETAESTGNNLERKGSVLKWKKGHFVEFPKKMSATMVGRWRKYLGLFCSRQPYIELFYVEQKVKIIINNTLHGILELGALGGGGGVGVVTVSPSNVVSGKIWQFCLIKKKKKNLFPFFFFFFFFQKGQIFRLKKGRASDYRTLFLSRLGPGLLFFLLKVWFYI